VAAIAKYSIERMQRQTAKMLSRVFILSFRQTIANPWFAFLKQFNMDVVSSFVTSQLVADAVRASFLLFQFSG
jgi:hypothetical protein